MSDKRPALLLLCCLVLICISGCASSSGVVPESDASELSPPVTGVHNVIIMIGDGMGFEHLAAAESYEPEGVHGDVFGRFDVRLAMSTFSADGSGYDASSSLEYSQYVREGATDSAAAATAISTGRKTYNGAIGVVGDPSSPTTATHLMEVAEDAGLSTGVVTSVQISHATPAGFVAHEARREDYSAIARDMLVDSAVDVIMGAGHPWFDDDGDRLSLVDSFQYIGGEDTWEALISGRLGGDADADGVDNPWRLVDTRQGFLDVASATTPGRVFGLAPVARTLAQKRSGADDVAPGTVPYPESVPTLAEMTAAALNVVDDDPQGFVLMVEGGAIDWASHANQSGRMLEELDEFEGAVQTVWDWVEENSNWSETLLVVTADHETGCLALSEPNALSEESMSSPYMDRFGGMLPDMRWGSTGHTNSFVPLLAQGAGATLFYGLTNDVDPIRGSFLDNTALSEVILRVIR